MSYQRSDKVELLPGMFARVRVVVATIADAVTIPMEAVAVILSGEKKVYVVEAGKVTGRVVTTGIEDGGRIQIVAGLHTDDRASRSPCSCSPVSIWCFPENLKSCQPKPKRNHPMPISRQTTKQTIAGLFLLICSVCVALSPRYALANQEWTVREKFPNLSTGMFDGAVLAPLDKGMVLVADWLLISEADLMQSIAAEEPELQKQLAKDLFFVLEQVTIRRLLVREAKLEGFGQEGLDDETLIEQFLEKKYQGLSTSDDEIDAFYRKNKKAMGDASLEDLRESIRENLVEEKREEAVTAYIAKLSDSLKVRIDSKWVEEQNRTALDNPVDKARGSGKPTMVEFGATGCVPCDMMQPILDGLRKNYKDKLNVVFVHVGEEQVLAGRYGIRAIPAQVFFDAGGREVFRHIGFFAAEEVNKQLLAMGVPK